MSNDMEKITELIKEDRIRKIKHEKLSNVYLIEGKEHEYLVYLPNYCTCRQFIFRNIKEKGTVCKHIKAVNMSTNVPEVEIENWREYLKK